MSSPPKANRFQGRIRKLYLQLFRGVKSDDARLSVAKAYGEFAMQNYTGHFREPEIETFLSNYHKNHYTNTIDPASFNENILIHIVTQTYSIGGHSRFLENLIQLDDKHQHHLIITDQGDIPHRESIYQLIEKQNGTLTELSGDENAKGQEMIDSLTKLGGKIMLHHHPSDVLPSIALPVINELYPIYYFNHADHCYAYGFELDPIVINIRDEAARITYHWRNCKKNTVLPLPILKPDIKESREEVFKKYNLDPDLKLGLCVGGMHKLKPKGEFNFFRTMYQALTENETLQVAVVGVREEKIDELELSHFKHKRFHFLGPIPDPSEIQAHTDIAIDPIPLGSYTADLETCYYGAFPLCSYNPVPLFDLTKDPSLMGYSAPKSESEYLQMLKLALKEHTVEKKQNLIKAIQQFHCGNSWLSLFINCLIIREVIERPAPEGSKQIIPQFQNTHDNILYNCIQCIKLYFNDVDLYHRLKLNFKMVNTRIGIRDIILINKTKSTIS